MKRKEENYSKYEMAKKQLVGFMNSAGFDWVHDIAYENGFELVASKKNDSDELWWRPLQVEGSGFVRLFTNSIKQLQKLK